MYYTKTTIKLNKPKKFNYARSVRLGMLSNKFSSGRNRVINSFMFYSNLDIDFTIVSSYFIEPINLYKSGATPLVLLLLLLLAVPSLLTLHQLSDELELIQLITHKKQFTFSLLIFYIFLYRTLTNLLLALFLY